MKDDTEEQILDDSRPTNRVTDPRVEPVTPFPPAPGPMRTRSGELLLALRTPSEVPPDPFQVRLDQWGEAIIATVEDAKAKASSAHEVAGRASKDNEDQNGAIGVLVGDVAVVKKVVEANTTAIEALQGDNALGAKFAKEAAEKLSRAFSPQVASLAGAALTILAGAIATWMRSKGWLP